MQNTLPSYGDILDQEHPGPSSMSDDVRKELRRSFIELPNCRDEHKRVPAMQLRNLSSKSSLYAILVSLDRMTTPNLDLKKNIHIFTAKITLANKIIIFSKCA